jgi:hypothetical protein
VLLLLLLQDADQLYGPKAMASDPLFECWRTQQQQGGDCASFCLPPRESVDVQLAFEPPAGQQQRDDQSEAAGASADELVACFRGCLTAVFGNGSEQLLPLEVQLLRPAVYCRSGRQQLDFGTIHATSSRVMELELCNPTQVDAAWSASITSASSGSKRTTGRRSTSPGRAAARTMPDAPRTPFSLQLGSGVLPGRGIGIPRTVRLAVAYCPAQVQAAPIEGLHKAMLEVRVKGSGGPPLRVALVGCSSLQEALEHGALMARI